MTRLPIGLFTGWLATGQRGTSSETIVTTLTGIPICQHLDHPYDPADFYRCEKLLQAVPLARMALPTMRAVSPEWSALVDHWDELAALLAEEAPSGAAPKMMYCFGMYRRMQELL